MDEITTEAPKIIEASNLNFNKEKELIKEATAEQITQTTKEFETHLKIQHQIQDIMKTVGTRRIQKLILNKLYQRIFPVYSNDTIQDIVDRFTKMFSDQATGLVDQFKDSIADERGFSLERTSKKICDIPAEIYYAGISFDDKFWVADKFKNYNKFCVICSKLASKNAVIRG